MNNDHLLISSVLFAELCGAECTDLPEIQTLRNSKIKTASSDEVTYSSLMREIGRRHSPDVLREFRKIFKDTFDQAILENKEDAEELALAVGLEFLNGLDHNIEKAASAIEMGDPVYAGKYIAEIIKFLLRRISPARRAKSLSGLRRKIYMLNEVDIAQKKMPASSALGQAISLTKNLLMMHTPDYVRAVINSIVRNLE
jgi:hypothetical protein